MDIGRRHKPPGSEKKRPVYYSTSSNESISAFVPISYVSIPTGQCKEDQVMPAHAVSYDREEDLL